MIPLSNICGLCVMTLGETCKQISYCWTMGTSEPFVTVILNRRQRLWWLTAKIILKPSAERHRKMSVLTPHCEIICSVQLISCTCTQQITKCLCFNPSVQLKSKTLVLEPDFTPPSRRQALTSDLWAHKRSNCYVSPLSKTVKMKSRPLTDQPRC